MAEYSEQIKPHPEKKGFVVERKEEKVSLNQIVNPSSYRWCGEERRGMLKIKWMNNKVSVSECKSLYNSILFMKQLFALMKVQTFTNIHVFWFHEGMFFSFSSHRMSASAVRRRGGGGGWEGRMQMLYWCFAGVLHPTYRPTYLTFSFVLFCLPSFHSFSLVLSLYIIRWYICP